MLGRVVMRVASGCAPSGDWQAEGELGLHLPRRHHDLCAGLSPFPPSCLLALIVLAPGCPSQWPLGASSSARICQQLCPVLTRHRIRCTPANCCAKGLDMLRSVQMEMGVQVSMSCLTPASHCCSFPSVHPSHQHWRRACSAQVIIARERCDHSPALNVVSKSRTDSRTTALTWTARVDRPSHQQPTHIR